MDSMLRNFAAGVSCGSPTMSKNVSGCSVIVAANKNIAWKSYGSFNDCYHSIAKAVFLAHRDLLVSFSTLPIWRILLWPVSSFIISLAYDNFMVASDLSSTNLLSRTKYTFHWIWKIVCGFVYQFIRFDSVGNNRMSWQIILRYFRYCFL